MDKWLAAGVAGLFALTASAASATTTTCSTVAACLMGVNSSSGYGLEGTSKSGDGVVGITTENAMSASAGKAGVTGYDSSTNKNKFNSGVYGTSSYGNGVQGKSTSGIGVVGISKSGEAVTGTSSSPTGPAIYGAETSASDQASTSGATGVVGWSERGSGVAASVDYEYGIYGESGDGAGVGAHTFRPQGVALEATASGGDIFHGSNSSGMVALIDDSGNMTLAGTLTTNKSPNFRTTDSTGAQVLTYGSRSTMATIEDLGEASLVNGSAYVRLDPEFGRIINARSRYMVFITPEGDSRGLYTANMSPRGFQVRENGGGHSTLQFTYRIAARPLDDVRQLRLPSTASIMAQQLKDLKTLSRPAFPKDPRKTR